jgi:gamma-glutamyltranspeptidase/glutathione hydrolase
MRLLAFLILLGSCSHKVRIVAPTAVEPRVAHEATAKNEMVTTQGLATTRAALRMFAQGGNIIDAFVAASFAISVERPHSTGLGGGGFLMYYDRDSSKVYAFDFRELAPLKAYSKMYLDKKGAHQPMLSREGSLSVATPGLVRGLYAIHQRYGHLSWKEVMEPAIVLARDGFPLYDQLEVALKEMKSVLHQDPEMKSTFYTASGEVPLLGTTVKQPNLANTLELISHEGETAFYQGRIARAIVNTVKSKKGLLRHKDLRNYKMKEREPVTAVYKGLKVFSMPPPSSGGIHVIQILKMLEDQNLKSMGPQSADATHLTALSMQRAFLDRATYLGDPDFHTVPVKELLDPRYLKTLANSIRSKKAISAGDLKPVPLPHESDDTTHFTIADSHGNLVASTQTINGWFGSGVMAQGTGVILNNEMDDFAQKVGVQNLFGAVGGANNLVEPGKRPLSSMSPTIILKDKAPYMALGSPSGTKIITCVAQTILNTVEYEMPLYEAVAATRVHQQWQPDELRIESPFLSKKVEAELTKRGHKIVHGRLGCSIQAIKREGKQWVGVSDPRGEGLALGR